MSIIDILGTPPVALLCGLIIAGIGYHQIYPEDEKAWGFDGIIADASKRPAKLFLLSVPAVLFPVCSKHPQCSKS